MAMCSSGDKSASTKHLQYFKERGHLQEIDIKGKHINSLNYTSKIDIVKSLTIFVFHTR